MLNFVIEPRVLESYVPAGVELDLWRGRCYVSIVGFQFVNTSVLGIPAFFHRDFEEVNLRFYVVRQTPDGPRRGVVFLREIVPKYLATWIANWLYNENYVTMPMRRRVEPGVAEYEWWHAKRWNRVSAQFQGEPTVLAAGSEEEFITEHYWGYTKQRDGGTMVYQVEHPAWRVWPASSAMFDCDVEAVYGKAFVPHLRDPASAFVADGSDIVVRRGERI
ncbi:MAG: DUF2071 domain-containing protein [Planctomycetes bacterium]|nr:DUF2071 domain-containing protein [Planctomycetota bacterium]